LPLDLARLTRDRLIHLSLEGNRLMLEFLEDLSTLNSLSIELSNTSLWKTDKADSLLSHFSWHGVDGALNKGNLGDADLVILVDVRVLLDGSAVIHLRFKDTPNLGLLSFKLDASFLFSSDLREGFLGDWSALLRLRSVGMSSKLDRAHDTSLGGEDISSLVHVVVTTESTLGSIGGVVNLNSDSLTLVDKSDLRGVDHNCVVIGPLSSDPLKN